MKEKMKTESQGLTSKDCIFCKIVEGKALASIVYQDAKIMALMTTRPTVATNFPHFNKCQITEGKES